MAFLLRQISYSADGREIVRTSKIDDDLLRVGRDPSCDIRLSDLAVALQHLSIEQLSPSKVGLSAGPGLKFDLNGRSVNFGQIELAQGGDIKLAGHLLRIMPTPEGSPDVSINVERITEGETKLDREQEERFSLVGTMPGKRATAWVFSFLVLGLFLAWPIKSFYDQRNQEARTERWHADSTWISGSLSSAHAGLEKNCTACHVKPFEAVRDEACVACHTQIHDHADPVRLARSRPDITGWGKVELAFKDAFNLPPGRCVECHTEHQGPQVMPMTQQRFCSDCHVDLDSKLPDTQLANAGDFETAHPEFRPAVMVRWNNDRPVMQRVSLDRNPEEVSNLKFPHDIHLAKTGGVAQMARRLAADHGFGDALACKDCHVGTPDGVRFEPVNMEADCGMCHSLAFDLSDGTLRTLRHGEPEQVVADLRDMFRARAPSPPATLGGMSRRRPGEVMEVRNRVQFAAGSQNPQRAERAIRAVFSQGGACYDCHQVVAPPQGTLNYQIKPVAFPIRYMQKGWFDHRAHATETCESCHAAETSASATDLLLPNLASCRECHGGETTSKDVPSTCAMCHDYHMDDGAPSMLIRQQVRGKRRDTVAELSVAERAAARR